MDAANNTSSVRSANSNLYAPVKLWLEPSEVRQMQARLVMERLNARKADRRIEKAWGIK